MTAKEMDIDTLICKARGIIRVCMDAVGARASTEEDLEYALWTVSDLLSEAQQKLEESSERPDLGEDELAVQDKGGIMRFDQVFPTDRINIGVTPDGAVVSSAASNAFLDGVPHEQFTEDAEEGEPEDVWAMKSRFSTGGKQNAENN